MVATLLPNRRQTGVSCMPAKKRQNRRISPIRPLVPITPAGSGATPDMTPIPPLNEGAAKKSRSISSVETHAASDTQPSGASGSA